MKLFLMQIPIQVILGYVGGDVPTSFAKKYVSEISDAGHPYLPMCLLNDRHLDPVHMPIHRNLLRNGYFSKERACYLLQRDNPIRLFRCKNVPHEFAFEYETYYPSEFLTYPHLTLEEIRSRMHGTFSDKKLYCILSNPAIFSKGIEEAEGIISDIERIITERQRKNVAADVSCNEGAPLEFFSRNPQYVHWDILADNCGRVFRCASGSKEEEKVISFLESGMKEWQDTHWSLISWNDAIPMRFLLDNDSKLDLDYFRHNVDVPLPFLGKKPETIPSCAKWDSKHRCRKLDGHSSDGKSMYYSSINVSVDTVIKTCMDNPKAVSWKCLSNNDRFWLRLAERDLRPILESFFYGDSS